MQEKTSLFVRVKNILQLEQYIKNENLWKALEVIQKVQ